MIVLSWMVILSSCTIPKVREAQYVVAQADSLWHEGKMYGVDAGDSAALAQAYETFGKYSVFSIQFSDTYAHACYHYGKLLRAKDDPVSAMQAFINATHSPTRNYHILGRVYSNMGDIAHLANEFQLSYDMFEHAADIFDQNLDSVNHSYAVYRMAYAKAELADSTSCLTLINRIKNISNYQDYISITKAELYIKCHVFDSAIYYADLLINSNLYTPTCALIKAQAYDDLGRKDSALLYANILLDTPDASYQNKFNTLYVVLHNDSDLTAEDINSYFPAVTEWVVLT